MANVDRPNGFRPSKSLIGAPWQSLIRKYDAADRSADTTNNHGDIYIGDPVTLVSGQVQVANSGDTVAGVVVAVGKDATTFGETGYYDPDNLSKRYLAADESGIVGIVPAEACLFEVQSAADLDLVAGDNADTTVAAATSHGSRTTSQSSAELTTGLNNDVKVVEQMTSPDNDQTLTNARYLVMFNTVEHAQ